MTSWKLALTPLLAAAVTLPLVNVAHGVSPVISGPAVPVIAHPVGLVAPGKAPTNSTIDEFTSYVPQVACDPREKPGVAAFRNLVLKKYPAAKDWGIVRDCAADGISEHVDGRAWDWNADSRKPAQYRAATNLLNWLTKVGPDGVVGYNARRLGIMYIGYRQRIFGLYRANEGWRAMPDRGDPTSNHIDHVHISFSWEGAYKRTSFWTGKKAAIDYGPCTPYRGQPAPLYSARTRNTTPCPTPAAVPKTFQKGPVLWRGTVGANVTALQLKLKVLPASGTFGKVTQKAVIRYQRSHHLTVTGAYDAATRTQLPLP